MGLQKLVEIFSCRTDIPVKIDDIVNQIKELGIQDEVTYIGVDFDIGVLRGQFVRLSTERNGVYADPIYRAEIYYAKNQSKDWQRLVICKELVHLSILLKLRRKQKKN